MWKHNIYSSTTDLHHLQHKPTNDCIHIYDKGTNTQLNNNVITLIWLHEIGRASCSVPSGHCHIIYGQVHYTYWRRFPYYLPPGSLFPCHIKPQRGIYFHLIPHHISTSISIWGIIIMYQCSNHYFFLIKLAEETYIWSVATVVYKESLIPTGL